MMNKIRCRDWIDTERAIWIISPEYNALLHVEKDTKIVTEEVVLGKYSLYVPEMYYASGVLSGDYIVCIPSAAKDIAVYSLRDKSICHIPVVPPRCICKEIYNPAFKFYRGYAYDENVLIFGISYPALLNLNLKTKRIEYLCDWVMHVERHIPQGDTHFYFGDGYVNLKKKLIIPMNCCNAFLSIELKTLQCRLVFPPDKMDGIECVVKAEDKLCFIGRKGKLYYLCVWNPDIKEMRKFQIPCQGGSPGWISFLSPIFWKSKVYLVPQTADHFYVVDLESEKVEIEKNLEVMISEFPGELQDIKVGTYKQNGNIVIFNTGWDYQWHKYNLDTWEHEDFELTLNDENYIWHYQKALCRKWMDENEVISENEMPFSVFFEEIKNMERPRSEWEDPFGTKEQKWKTFLKTGH